MGSQQSTRRVTVINDEASGVIKITDSVVDRLRNELDKSTSNQKAAPSLPAKTNEPVIEPLPAPEPEPIPPPPPPPAPPKETPPPPPPPPIPTPEPPKETPAPPPSQPSPPTPTPPPPPIPTPPPVVQEAPPIIIQKPIIHVIEKEVNTITSLRVKNEKENELAEAEAYWRKRFVQQEQEHSALSHLQMSALANTADKLSRMFATERCPPLCQEQRDSVLQCCKENSQKPLLCSEAVKKFSSCVHSTRMASG